MKLSKVVTVFIGIIVICFGVFQPGSIFEINLFAFSGMAIFVVPILFGIYGRKQPRREPSQRWWQALLLCCSSP